MIDVTPSILPPPKKIRNKTCRYSIFWDGERLSRNNGHSVDIDRSALRSSCKGRRLLESIARNADG